MYAIVESGGRQYQLQVGRYLDIDLVESKPGDPLCFERVLMIVNGGASKIGQPYLEGAQVKSHILRQVKGRKVIVYKQRPKKGTRKKQGHRQKYTRIFIDSIVLNEQVLAEASDTRQAKVKPQVEVPEEKQSAQRQARKTKSSSGKPSQAKASRPGDRKESSQGEQTVKKPEAAREQKPDKQAKSARPKKKADDQTKDKGKK